MPRDWLRPLLQTAVYILLWLIADFFARPMFDWAGGFMVGVTVGGLAAAVFANVLSLSIFGPRPLTDIGFPWNSGMVRNAALGLAGGVGSAVVVLCAPLLLHMATINPNPDPGSNWRTLLFTPFLLLCGALGEELFFHGFGFQLLLRAFGTYATVLPVGVLFGFLHSSNPHFSNMGLANTAGFGILFGLAFLRSHDLWLPIGLHFGWNFTLPLFGVNLSGLTMRPTGIEIVWKAGPLWSGGEYGPEASILTSGVLILLLIYILKIPVQRQYAPLCDSPSADALPPSPPSTPLMPPTA
jgi:membrane protease YdiL (CAAX protease family)